ncbi:MAG: MATE family efflux transporter [Phycisphaerae bacterium]|nr:MATE family efflux transporter [Phycisphaerae bacterium]
MPDAIDESASVEGPVAESASRPPAPANHLLTRSVTSALLWLALPVLAEQSLFLLLGLTEMFLAGTISKEATTAIGLASQVGWLAGLLFSFVGVGATALVSRHTGMGDPKQANHFANQAMGAAVLMGVAACALLQLAAPYMPGFLHWKGEAAEIGVRFLRIDACGHITGALVVIAAACWRGTGDTRTPLYIMCAANLFNILVSTTLRFGWGPIPSYGVMGIAYGTLCARILGGAIAVALLLRGRSGLQLLRRELPFRSDSMSRLLRVGIPAGIDGIFLWSGQFAFLMIISNLATGEEQAATVAAHFVGIRVEALSYLPAWAWGVAAATMVGQSLGAGQPDRARRSGHLAAVQGAGLCLLMGVGYFVFAKQIYAVMNSSGDLERVSAIGVPALRLLAFFQIPCALMIIYPNALRGAGDTRYPLLYTLLGMVIWRLPLAYLCGVTLNGGLVGAWIGMCLDMTFRAICNAIRFTRGRWDAIQV